MAARLVKGLNGLGQGWLWISLLLTPILALAGGLGFQVAGFFIGLSGLLAWVADRSGADYLRSAWPLCLIAFLLWAWASTLWSPYEDELFGGNASILFALVLLLLFIPLVVSRLSETARNIMIWVVIGVGLLGVALLFIEAASGYALSMWGDPVSAGEDPIKRRGDAEMNLGRGQVSFAILLWPVAAFLTLRLKEGWLLALSAFVALILSAHMNNLSIITPALILGGVFAALAYWKPRFGLTLGFLFAVASLIFAPILGFISAQIDVESLRHLPLSWEHRVRMWAYSWELIQQAPLIGHGFDASRFYEELTFKAPDGRDIVVMSMHPHNIGLQIWLETGIVGVLLAVAFLLGLMKAALKICRQPGLASAACGLLVTIAASGAATVGAWQHWWWALIVLAIGLLCLYRDSAQKLGNSPKSLKI